mmetsp:Transcript_32104/g.102316  ORF Transcript_32104/g.102316 Transcript_32104/m.102316 type:complete len:282 (+) Transcript_32104:29-874(+)
MLHLLGTRKVVINGIVSQPALNGQIGTALSFSHNNMRYGVRLEDGRQLSLKAENVKRYLDAGEIEEAARAEPSEELFNLYCSTFPAAKQDPAFQTKHRLLGGVSVPGVHMKACEGCPESLFGTSYVELHEAQRAHPKVVAWNARQEALSKCTNAAALSGELLPPDEAPPLRFKVGDEVMARNGQRQTDYSPGVVVAQHYTEEGWPAGFWAAYQIRLTADWAGLDGSQRPPNFSRGEDGVSTGPLIYAQYDSDFLVKGMPVVGGVTLSALDENAQVAVPNHF